MGSWVAPCLTVRRAQGYQAMQQLIIGESLAPGMQRGLFRQLDPGATAGMLMTIYLVISSTVDEEERSWRTPAWFAELVLDGLRKAVD